MLNEKMRNLGANRSIIRELFEYGRIRREAVGEENVFDFTLGNPSVVPPKEVNDGLSKLISEMSPTKLHGYTAAQGDKAVRVQIAEFISQQYGFCADSELIYLTTGAAAGLTSVLTAVLNPGDEVIVPAPYFPEYRVFIERTGSSLVPVLCNVEDFSLDIPAIAAAINEKTRAIILNSPNNPTGAVYSGETIEQLSALLKEKSDLYGEPIYIVADEPYRELVYDNAFVPYIPNFYPDTVVCYSFSKSLSVPGERIGYVSVSPKSTNPIALYQAICGAGRALGFVCAPSMFQFLIPLCLGKTADISIYDRNRQLLLSALTEYGYRVVRPQGAFYLFIEAPGGDAYEFCERAKAYDLLLVPSNDFGCPGFVRLAYCVSTEMVERSLPVFKALAESYNK